MARKTTKGAKAKPQKAAPTAKPAPERGGSTIYTLEAFLTGGPVAERFVKKNPVVARTIEIRGDQTLADLHDILFQAFDRDDEHMYEFQFGKGPMDPDGPRYVLPMAAGDTFGPKPAGRVDKTRLDALKLQVGDRFGYWFDFGDDWWHQINVEAVETKVPEGKYPKITKRTGASPPQYADLDD